MRFRHGPTSPHLHRSRWASVGAAIAVSLGAGGLMSASATIGDGQRAVYVPITPCRVMDTRAAPETVGPRATPIGAADTHVISVLGVNGNCTIPLDAVGVAMNVVAIAPTAASFLTVYPAGAARPLASSLNWVAGQAPVPNAVTSQVSADGRIAFYNLTGTVDLAADIVGFYVDHHHDDRYYTEAEVDARQAVTNVRLDKAEAAILLLDARLTDAESRLAAAESAIVLAGQGNWVNIRATADVRSTSPSLAGTSVVRPVGSPVGVYCVILPPAAPVTGEAAVASIQEGLGVISPSFVSVTVTIGHDCDATGATIAVDTYDSSGGHANRPFTLVIPGI